MANGSRDERERLCYTGAPDPATRSILPPYRNAATPFPAHKLHGQFNHGIYAKKRNRPPEVLCCTLGKVETIMATDEQSRVIKAQEKVMSLPHNKISQMSKEENT